MSEDTVTGTTVEEIVVTEQPEPLTIEQVEALLAAQFPPIPEPAPFPGDDTATWVYWTDMDTAERGVPDEWVWERLRNKRNALLSACDFRMVSDAPWDTAAWATYRQALRDMTDTLDPRKAVWPAEPE